MCSSGLSGKEQSLTVPHELLWPTSFVHRDVARWMWCSRLRAGCRLRLPFIASLHYINSPKLAISHQQKFDKSCKITKEQNTTGYFRLEFAVDPMIRYRMAPFCRLPLPIPSPFREWFSRVKVAPADRTCRPTRGKCAVTALGEVGGWRGKPAVLETRSNFVTFFALFNFFLKNSFR